MKRMSWNDHTSQKDREAICGCKISGHHLVQLLDDTRSRKEFFSQESGKVASAIVLRWCTMFEGSKWGFRNFKLFRVMSTEDMQILRMIIWETVPRKESQGYVKLRLEFFHLESLHPP